MRGIERIFFHEGVRRWINVDTGEVYNKRQCDRIEPYLDENCEFHGGFWTKGSKRYRDGKMDKYDYRICVDGKFYLVHRLVASFIPNTNNYPQVDHINRDPSDNRISNLRWVTQEVNLENQDRVDAGIEKYGVRYCEDERSYMKAYREAHKDEKRTRDKAYYERHRAEILARRRAKRYLARQEKEAA